MDFVYKYLFDAMWLAFVVYWWAMSKNVKTASRVEPVWSRALRLLAMICVLYLFFVPRMPISMLSRRFIPLSATSFWIGAALTAAGISFSIWARYHLGRNWSRAVTVMQEHELITNGPYRLARHPIYTGILLALTGSAIALGEWRGLLAVALLFFILLYKLTLEEKWMRETFGNSYEAYAKRTSALVPFLI